MARLPIESQTPTHVRFAGGAERDNLLAFAGCNYLGLGSHPRVVAALARAASLHGISTTASRETTGNTLSHESLEQELAAFIGQEAAILSAEGYTANFMLTQTLATTRRVAVIDQRAHRSLRHAAVAAGMHVCEYEHLNPRSAKWLCEHHADQGVAILTDSVFAADGAIAPLRELLDCLPTRRSTLVVDDCHGLCVLGPGGAGAVAHAGLDDDRVVITTTLAKGLGCYGGAVVGRKKLIDQTQAGAWVYRSSTPIPPAIAEACREALRVVRDEPRLLDNLRVNVERMRDGMYRLGLPLPPDGVPIFTFALAPESRMHEMHERMKRAGVFAPLIEYPGGPTPLFFRVVVNAAHTTVQIQTLVRELGKAMEDCSVERAQQPSPDVVVRPVRARV